VLNLHGLGLQKHADCSLKAMLLTKKGMKNKPLMVIIGRNMLAHRYIWKPLHIWLICNATMVVCK